MTGTRTFIPTMPKVFVDAWFTQIWPKRLAEHSSASTGSILDPPDICESSELQRIKQFGPSWTWMSYTPAQKEYFRALDRGETPPPPPPEA